MGDDSNDDGAGLKPSAAPMDNHDENHGASSPEAGAGDRRDDDAGTFDPDRLVFADEIEPGPKTDDRLEFAVDAANSSASPRTVDTDNAWLVLVVDDDPDVLTVTQMGFRNLEILGRPVQLICAQSAQEARDILSTQTRVAVLLTDVVMETDTAGLDLVHWLRAQPKGHTTRVVVRTGQPGLAPEEVVLRRYDINDYWPKTAVEMGRMRSQLIGLIRSFNDIEMLQSQTEQLGQLVSSVDSLIGLSRQADVFEHLEREMACLSIGWACFSVKRHGADGVDVDLLRVSERSSEEMTTCAHDALKEVLREGEASDVESDVPFIVKLTAFESSEAIGVVFCLQNVAPELRSLLALRATIYGQAVRSAALQERTVALYSATKRFVPERTLKWLGRDDISNVESGDHVSVFAWVMFVDIRGFTARVESATSEQIQRLLQRAFGEIIPTVEAHGGVVDKLLGDGLMALFRTDEAPIACCIELVELIEGLDPDMRLSIGLHGGSVNLCALGYRDRLEITAIADAVNIAARLEQATRRYHATIITSASAVSSLEDPVHIQTRPLGKLQIRGRRGLVDAVEVLAGRRVLNKAAGAQLVDVLGPSVDYEAGLAALEDLLQRYPHDHTLRVLMADFKSRKPADCTVAPAKIKPVQLDEKS
ncbi:MAG: adenylate/guanylate cyclase domain-containing protein [Bradymonadia bacterium]